MTYVLIGLRRSGKCLPTFFACANVRFRPSDYSSTAPMSFLHECRLQKSCTHGLPFFSLPSFSRAGWGWMVSRCPCVASRGFPSPARLWSSGRGGEASGRAFGARELTSVSSVHSWTRDSGVALWRRTPATCSAPVGSPSSSLHTRRGFGEGESSGACVCSRLPLPPHLCTLSEVLVRVSRPSAAPVRVLPGLLIFGLGSREGV